jgi:hypothetical protein
MGERLDRTQEVAGSSPASSMKDPANAGLLFRLMDTESAWKLGETLAAESPIEPISLHIRELSSRCFDSTPPRARQNVGGFRGLTLSTVVS